VLPNFIMVVGNGLAFFAAFVLAVATGEWEALAIWLELFPFAVLLWWLCLEPNLKRNGRTGSSYVWDMVEKLVPAAQKEMVENKLRYYLFPDVWFLVVLTAAGYAVFPLGILLAILFFPSHFATWWYSTATAINVASAVMLYRASKPEYGGGQEAWLMYESTAPAEATPLSPKPERSDPIPE